MTVTQTGDLNNASVESHLGSDNDLTVSQTGNNHVADVCVNAGMNGGGNLVDVVQTASFNTAQVDVYGSNNHAYVYQGGN